MLQTSRQRRIGCDVEEKKTDLILPYTNCLLTNRWRNTYIMKRSCSPKLDSEYAPCALTHHSPCMTSVHMKANTQATHSKHVNNREKASLLLGAFLALPMEKLPRPHEEPWDALLTATAEETTLVHLDSIEEQTTTFLALE